MEKFHETKELDLKKSSKGIWLVKIPKYLSEAWHNGPPGSEIGKLKIYTSGTSGSTRAVFTINDATKGDTKVPLDHEFIMKKDTGDQNLAIVSMGMIPSAAGSASVEGQVKQRCEFKPSMSDDYLQLSRKRVVQSNKPTREVIHLSETVNNFKPKSNHDFNIEYENKKKEEGKKVRADKEKVMDMLFSAFEKHQYYNIKDLGKITNQPMAYLKEILREICTYNVKAPYKNTWELKKEFRHYRGESTSAPK